jgi:hypothetical protein
MIVTKAMTMIMIMNVTDLGHSHGHDHNHDILSSIKHKNEIFFLKKVGGV